MDIENLKVAIYWGSYLVFPFLLLLWWLKRKGSLKTSSLVVWGLLSLLFIWTRFVEPNLIRVQVTEIQSHQLQKRIAVISDMHLGIYKGALFMRRVVDKLNALKPDMVLIAGDFSYHPTDFNELIAPLNEIKAPVYAVLGNHDVGAPGADYRQELSKAIRANGVKLLENEIVRFDDFTLVGLGDRFVAEDNARLLKQVEFKEEVIVLTHNPDTTLDYRDVKADYTICGHTHGGQVRLPFIGALFLPVSGPFDHGLYREANTQLFVSSGLGEMGLPFRLLNPPVIDVLQFTPRKN